MNDRSTVPVVATLKAKPGQRETLLEILQQLAAESPHDAGCASYALFESKDDAGEFYTLEEWESEDALRAHLAKHADLVERAKPVLAVEPKITVLLPR